MAYKDEVCLWFKNNEPHRRLELLCGLLNMCLPLELRFIGSCVEDLGKRDFHDLREAQYKANNTQEVSQLEDLLDERTRSKVIVFIALLNARNHTCSSLLYQIITGAQQVPQGLAGGQRLATTAPPAPLQPTPPPPPPAPEAAAEDGSSSRQEGDQADSEGDPQQETQQVAAPKVSKAIDADYIKEMLLIYTMVLHHPAFTFDQKRVVAEMHAAALRLEEQLCRVLSQTRSTANEQACDSGLSIGTEPEGDTVSDGSGLLPTPGPPLHFHQRHNPTMRPGVPSHSVSQTVDEGGGSQDACSSGESSELYNEGGTVPTTYIYNSSIFDQQSFVALNNNLLTMNPGYHCNHQSSFHYYTYPQVVGALPASIPGARGAPSEGSSSEDGAITTTHAGPPTTTSPLSSAQSSPYASPLQSLSPSRASSPWSRPTTTTTTTTTTTAANLPLTITSSTTTTSKCAVLSIHSSPRIAHKYSPCVTQASSPVMTGSSCPVTHSGTTSTGQTHRGKPPAASNRPQRQADRSGSRTRLPVAPTVDAGVAVGNQNSQSTSRSIVQTSATVSCSSGHSKSSSSRWSTGMSTSTTPSTSSPCVVATPAASVRSISRQNSQSPCPTSGATTTCKSPTTSTVIASSSSFKTNSSHTISGITTSLVSTSTTATTTTRNTSSPVVQEKIVHSIGNSSGIRSPPPSTASSSSIMNTMNTENSVVNNNNCLNYEFCKNEKLNKYYHRLSEYPVDKLKRMTDRELSDLGLTKSALTKLRRVLAGLESPNYHCPNGFTSPPTTPHPHSSPQANHTSFSQPINTTQNQMIMPNINHSNLQSQPASNLNPSITTASSSDNILTLHTTHASTNSTHSVLQGTHQSSVKNVQNTNADCPVNGTSERQNSSPNTLIPTSTHESEVSSSTSTTTSCAVTVVTISCANHISPPVTLANIATTETRPTPPSTATQVTQCHTITIPPSQKVPNVSQPPPFSSCSGSTTTPVITAALNTQGSHSNCGPPISSTTSQPTSAVPTSVSATNCVPHYMTTPPPCIQLKTPPLSGTGQHHITTQPQHGQLRTPPPPLCVPPRTPSREPVTSSTTNGLNISNGSQQAFYTSNNGPIVKNNAAPSCSIAGPAPSLPGNLPGYGNPVGLHTSSSNVAGSAYTSTASVAYTVANNMNMTVYTSSGNIGVPPPTNGGLMPMVPTGGSYPATYLYPLLGGPTGSHTYVPPGSYAAQHPHRPVYISHMQPMGHVAHMKPTHQMGGPVGNGSNSRGGSSSSSSSISSGSVRGFNKVNQRNHGQVKGGTRSSDSSPSSSQYSSPPQTPSPDHTRETDKRGKNDGAEPSEAGENAGLLGSGASEEGTPPPLHHPPNPILMPSHTNLAQPRYVQYQHLGYMGFQPGIRYQSLPLSAPTHVVAPRNPLPLNGDKSSRETTPPASVSLPLVQQDPQCCIRSTDTNVAPTTSAGGSHGRNGGSPHTVPPLPDGSLPPVALTPVPSIASATTAQVPPGNLCSGARHSNVQYNAPSYPVIMGTHMFPHLSGFMPAHSTALSNGFVSPSLPPNIAYPTMGNGMNADFGVYGGQYPVLGGNSQGGGASNSGGGPGTACGTPSVMGPPSTPGPGLAAGLPYPHHYGMPHTPNPSAGGKKTCYNCGQLGHRGAECKEANIEEMCKRTKDRPV